jgi:choline dehydrogenase-like flavoprotein
VPFFDARKLDDDTTIDVDVCVAGSGAAGISLAREFLGQPVRIALLESGELRFAHRPQFLNIGEDVGIENHAPSHSRFRIFGGSTARWGGKCRPLDPIDFEARSWIPYSGWPFSYADLEPWYRRAHKVCNLGACTWTAPKADETLSLAGAAGALENQIFHFSHPRDFGQAFRPEFEGAANVDVFLHSNVVEIEVDPDVRKVTGIRVATLNGRRHRIRARAYVLACGGLENPRLLLASNRVAPAGLGNEHDLVGRFFMDHVYLLTGYFEPALPDYARGLHIIQDLKRTGSDQPSHTGVALSRRVLCEEQLNGCVAYFIRGPRFVTLPEYSTPEVRSFVHLIKALRDWKLPAGQLGRHVVKALKGYKDIGILLGYSAADLVYPRPRLGFRLVAETTPRPDSRVMLSHRRDALGIPRIRVDWRLNATDRRGPDRLRELMHRAVGQGGLGRLVDHPAENGNGWPASLKGGKHHMGTTRMHADPKQGVVDPDCRVHSLANLYVAGSSVFPTCGYANPTFTIVALALRLADHLKERLRRPD